MMTECESATSSIVKQNGDRAAGPKGMHQTGKKSLLMTTRECAFNARL